MESKIAVVTGVSHSQGIGAAVCRELAKKGIDVFFTYWMANETWPGGFRKELEQKGIQSDCMEVNLALPEAASKVLAEAESRIGTPTILVNNAAQSTRDGFEQLDAQILDAHYAVNMRATMLLCAGFSRMLRDTQLNSGRIINLISGQGQGPMVKELAYGSTKGAISAFTLSLSAEVAPLGITVNAVNPGPTNTGWMTDELKAEIAPKFLMGRLGEPADAARLITFLASEEAAWITGQVIHSEGGFTRR